MGLISDKTYEDILGDGIERALAKGATALDDFVASLNEANIRGPAGQAWTADLLAKELQRLGP